MVKTQSRSHIRPAYWSMPASGKSRTNFSAIAVGPETRSKTAIHIGFWRQYASAFWDDIRLSRVLPFREAREEEVEKHVHPLQLSMQSTAV